MRAAMAHYDRTSAAVADITVGEDEVGVWFSGRLRDGVTEKQVYELRAAGISGDWRRIRVKGQRNYEMMAALAVNVPGYPIPRVEFGFEGGEQMSLVAAGMPLVVPLNEEQLALKVEKAQSARAVFRKLEAAKIRAQFSSITSKGD